VDKSQRNQANHGQKHGGWLGCNAADLLHPGAGRELVAIRGDIDDFTSQSTKDLYQRTTAGLRNKAYPLGEPSRISSDLSLTSSLSVP
jgi:hypothetical protein